MSGEIENFDISTYRRIEGIPISLGDDRRVYAIGKGNINVLTFNGKSWVP